MERFIPYPHKLCAEVSFTETHQMPKMKAYHGDAPEEIVAFHRARYIKGDSSKFIHFFIPDEKFKCFLGNPDRYIELCRRFGGIIAPDASVYAEMPMPFVQHHSCVNKLVGAWLQKQGVNVIPNVSWSHPWSYGFCFDGIPKHSVIAVNSTGIGNDSRAKELWIKGYRQMLEVLHPTLILRYGAKQIGERDDISIYYPNDNFKSAHHGR